jgi:hypothetical protein
VSNNHPVMLNGTVRHHRKAITGKKFLVRVMVMFVLLAAVSIFIHVGFDIYGLFRPVEGRRLQVYHNERISKYLLSHRYIPQEFNTVILGTSLSDNLDVTPYHVAGSSLTIYNASMMGANISEVATVGKQLVERGIRNVIFCVSPYQMKNSGAKEVELNGLIRRSGIAPHQYPAVHINEYGVNFFTERYRVKDVRQRILEVRGKLKGQPFVIDSTALRDFSSLLQSFSEHDVKLMIYFHPVPQELYESQEAEYERFRLLVTSIAPADARTINFNGSGYDWFRKDYSNYIDNGHLSEKGQSIIMKILHDEFQ